MWNMNFFARFLDYVQNEIIFPFDIIMLHPVVRHKRIIESWINVLVSSWYEFRIWKNFLRLTNKKPTLSTLSGCYLCHYKLMASVRVSREIDWDIPRDYYSHLFSAPPHNTQARKKKKRFQKFSGKKLLIKRLIHLKLTCIFTKVCFCIFQN